VASSARYGQHVLIIGPGLDDFLEPGRRIIILDDFYADIYGDYVFLGYDTLVENPRVDRADMIGLHNAAVLLDGGPAVVVCGKEPGPCLHAVAAHIVYRGGRAPEEALREAARLLQGLYGGEPEATPQGLAALRGLHAARSAAGGPEPLSLAVSLAANYGYGRSRLHLGEHVSWLAQLGAPREAVLAGLLHFLTESPTGRFDPLDLLETRLSALGEENLARSIPGAAEALRILRDYARAAALPAARLLRLVEALEPGGEHVTHVERRDGTVLVQCRTGPEGLPAKECLRLVQEAARLLPLEDYGLTELKPQSPRPRQ